MNDYENIINLSRPISNRPKISINDRAAQFAPFSALKGYDEKIVETSRLTDCKRLIDEDKKEILNVQINNILSRINERIEVEFTYFVKDKSKEGGEYQRLKGVVKKVDNVNKKIIMEDKKIIYFNDIIEIEF